MIGRHLLHQVPEVLLARQGSLDEDDGQVLPIADASRQHMDLASATDTVRVNEVGALVAPRYVASAGLVMKIDCFVSAANTTCVMLPMRLVVDPAVDIKGNLVHTDEVLQPIRRAVLHPS